MYMVVPGVTFSFKETGTSKVVATFSGSSVTYTGDNAKIPARTPKKLVENEEKRADYAKKKLIGELEKDRYKKLKESIKCSPGGKEYEKAKEDFYQKV